MESFLTVKEAASLWNLSERRVQMYCKEGRIPRAQKVNGIWLLPKDALNPKEEGKELVLHPECFYGKDTAVHLLEHPKGLQEAEGAGIREYSIVPGIRLVFQDIYAKSLDYQESQPELPKDLIAIQHCREGRFEGTYPDGEVVYMGPGSLSVNLPAWAPVSNSFPLGHYHGFYLAIMPVPARKSIEGLEELLGPMQIDFKALSRKLSEKNRLAVYSECEELRNLAAGIYPSGKTVRETALRLRVLELLAALSASDCPLREQEIYYTREQVKTVKEIRQYLIKNLDRRISLQQLSETFRISLTAMKRCFKGVYGMNIGKYMREYRLQSGAEELIRTNRNISDIAASLGYENASKFSEAFVKYFGMSPSRYRKTFCPVRGRTDKKE